MRYTYKSDFFLGSRNLDRNRNRLTNPLGLGTLLNRNRLGWRNWRTGAPCAATDAEAIALATISASLKKPSMGMPIATGTSLFVG